MPLRYVIGEKGRRGEGEKGRRREGERGVSRAEGRVKTRGEERRRINFFHDLQTEFQYEALDKAISMYSSSKQK